MTTAAERDAFDELFELVLEELPPEVAELLDEVPIVIEDEPTRELLSLMGIEARPGESDLCGLHSAVPLSERGTLDAPAFPGPIHLFRGPILRLAEWDPDETERQIRITLLHELGHHFGWPEEKLEDLGYE